METREREKNVEKDIKRSEEKSGRQRSKKYCRY